MADVEGMLGRFWERYKWVDDHQPPAIPQRTIPYMLHGDEGRGLGKSPIWICSFQPVMGWNGADYVNSKKTLVPSRVCLLGLRNTYTTRLLYTVLPAKNYAKDGASQERLLRDLVQDCNQLYSEGFEAIEIYFS